jgi:hypothetical protein
MRKVSQRAYPNFGVESMGEPKDQAEDFDNISYCDVSRRVVKSFARCAQFGGECKSFFDGEMGEMNVYFSVVCDFATESMVHNFGCDSVVVDVSSLKTLTEEGTS